MARQIFTWISYPIILAATLGTAIYLLGQGGNPTPTILAVQLSAFAFVIVFERLIPYHRSWNRSRKDVGPDTAHALTCIATGAFYNPWIYSTGILLGAWATTFVNSPLWPGGWPLIAQLGLALLVAEFFTYWVHRAQHQVNWLWRLHATHHSAPRLYWLNAYRFHFLDLFLNGVGGAIPLVALGAGPEVMVLFGLFTAVHGIFQHSNLPIRGGPLNWVLATTELHRWHHSPRMRESNTNFGQNLIVWDWLFGTRFLPADREPPEEIGIEDLPGFPMRYWPQLIAPLRWRRIVEARPTPTPTAEAI